MVERISQIKRELKGFFDSSLGTRHFSFIYGSYAYKSNTPKSDLDFVAICQDLDREKIDRTIEFAFNLYKRYGLAFDDEVPHERKLLASYEMLDHAIEGKGFELRGGRVYVPPVVKTKEFLNSEEIALRLLLNSITSKNIFVSGDRLRYEQKRREALEKMVQFMFSINQVDSFTLPEFVQALIGTPERNGEMYLGYKDKPSVREYLTRTFREQFKILRAKGALNLDRVRFYPTKQLKLVGTT